MATQRTVVKVEGAEQLIATLQEIAADFGYQKADKFLVGAARASMRPVLARAKALVPVDTGALRASLQVEARRPTQRDKRSQYVNFSDVAIAMVTTASGKKLKKKAFKNVRTGQKQVGIPSDARAIALEFGTRNVGAKPYLRPALESQQTSVLNNLASNLAIQLEKYRKNN